MIKAMLEMKEYKITAKDSSDNIETFMETARPNQAVIDKVLYGIKEKEVCKNFKDNQQIAPVPVIMISALPDAKATYIESGADYFLGKSFEMKDFFQTINAALSSQKII
jgi:DNA-binding response OmpR family regulator